MALVRRIALLALTCVSLYLVGPAVLDVFASWPAVRDLDPFLMQLIVIAQGCAFAAQWVLLRITLRESRWLNVVTSQLASTAASRVLPGGGAAANALQYTMLVRGGVPGPAAASGLTAASLMLTGTVFALPALALPAVIGGTGIDRSLARAAWAGAAALVLLVAAGALLLLSDAPLRTSGRLVQRAVDRVKHRERPSDALADRLLLERDVIRDVLSTDWLKAVLATAGRWAFDYASLLLALLAVGARPAPTAVLLAFCVAQALTLIPLTPGGLGFVEAGLAGTLALAGVAAGDALVAVLAYRLAGYWLPLPIGAVSYLVHGRSFPRAAKAARASPAG
jgi:uncharacterized protein (TIRG00374 family)